MTITHDANQLNTTQWSNPTVLQYDRRNQQENIYYILFIMYIIYLNYSPQFITYKYSPAHT